MSEYIVVGGELYHFGVKGMKWGVRKKKREERRAAKIAKKRARLEVQANTQVSNYYRNPIKMQRKINAKTKLYDMDTEAMLKGKNLVEKERIRIERQPYRPAISITGKETNAARARAENKYYYMVANGAALVGGILMGTYIYDDAKKRL